MHPNQSAAQWYLNHELQKIEARVSSELARIPQVKTLRELAQCEVIVPSYMRVVVRSTPTMCRFEQAKERRAEEIVEAQLRTLSRIKRDAGMSDEAYQEKLRQKYGQLLTREWCFLRGDFPRVLQQATQKGQKLIHRLTNSLS